MARAIELKKGAKLREVVATSGKRGRFTVDGFAGELPNPHEIWLAGTFDDGERGEVFTLADVELDESPSD